MRAYCIEDGEDGYRACLIPLATVTSLLAFAQQVQAEEREACAEVCVSLSVTPQMLLDEVRGIPKQNYLIYKECAAAIRAGETR